MAVLALFGAGLFANAQVIPADSLGGDSLKVVQDTVKKGKGSLKGGPVVAQDSVKKGKGLFKGDKSAPDSLKSVVVRRDDGDSTVVDSNKRKSILARIYPHREHYDPKVAVRRSAILPGWGQMYNRRWWKVPIIYAGFAGFAYFIAVNHAGYREYDRSVKCKGDSTCIDDPHPEYTSIKSVINIREGFRRYRDLNIIFTGLWYVLNVVDAYVDSHLREFNVSDDLSLDVHPSLMIDPFRQRSLQAGMTLTLRLRQ
ncbi:MAG: DUF5683 domain-containing protein [Bacteroidia bacterium]